MSASRIRQQSRPTAGATAERIEQLLQQHLMPEHLDIHDDSAAHAGHAAAGRGHFRVRIVSERFCGLRPLQRHRLVNDALSMLFEAGLHAVAMETLTPDEFLKKTS